MTRKQLEAYLSEHSADNSKYRRSRRIVNSLADEVPLRISELAYIVHEHDELPDRLVRNNPQVKSLSHCNRCHQNAEKGSFNEHEIRIPGYGRWDD